VTSWGEQFMVVATIECWLTTARCWQSVYGLFCCFRCRRRPTTAKCEHLFFLMNFLWAMVTLWTVTVFFRENVIFSLTPSVNFVTDANTSSEKTLVCDCKVSGVLSRSSQCPSWCRWQYKLTGALQSRFGVGQICISLNRCVTVINKLTTDCCLVF